MTDTTTATDTGTQTTDSVSAATTSQTAASTDGVGEGVTQQPSTEGQTSAASQADPTAQGQGQESTTQTGAPEKYEFTPTEGVTFEPSVIGGFSEVAKELGLTQESAQKILDKMGPVMAKQQLDSLEASRTEWQNQTRNDPEIGGANLEASLADAKKTTPYWDKDLSTLLEKSGLGDHPAVIRTLRNLGRQLGGDKFVGGKPPVETGQGDKSIASRLYPNQPN